VRALSVLKNPLASALTIPSISPVLFYFLLSRSSLFVFICSLLVAAILSRALQELLLLLFIVLSKESDNAARTPRINAASTNALANAGL